MRIRTIKPEFFKHDGLAALSPLTRLLFQGLWCLADCDGRLEDRPARIKVEILPYDKCDTNVMLEDLHAGGFITRYQHGKLRLIEVNSFARHQRISGKEAESTSRFPGRTQAEQPLTPEKPQETPGKQLGSTPEAPETTGNGREGKGRERETEGKDGMREMLTHLILAHLNTKADRQFRPTESNLKLISLRLSEVGNDTEGVKVMIDRMCAKWKADPKMCEFLRPETLFARSKFGGYYDNRLLPVADLLAGRGAVTNRPDSGFDAGMEEYRPVEAIQGGAQ